ncbi:hypothetical protein N9Z58_01280 [bacterium]|nr:hypothetical protein [bacterium]MDB4368746.1 hypothetical protein [bacterium]MDB4490132.1 hypothetical protein [bacterium]
MPQPRPDAVFIPKLSWTSNDAPAAVSYGALVGTQENIFLLPRSGTATAGFTLSFQRTQGAPTVDDIERLVGDQAQPIAQLEAALSQSLPEWQTRCIFPVAQLSDFEIFKGWKLWLGVSALLQVGSESSVGLRVPNKDHLNELRQFYNK